MDRIEQNLSNKFKEVVSFGPRERAELLSMLETWHSDSIDRQNARMKRLLSKTTPVPPKKGGDRASYKSGEILSLIPQGTQIKTILDLGAGSGDIMAALVRSLKIGRDQAWALTVGKLQDSPLYQVITYGENWEIPLPDGSLDLVIITQVLHHIHPKDRKGILAEVRKKLSSNGVVIIQEHDFRGDLETYLALDVLHTFWYVKNNEQVDGLFLMSKSQTAALFAKAGMRLEKMTIPKYWQWTYWASYTIGRTNEALALDAYLLSPEYAAVLQARARTSSALVEFDPISLYITALNKRLPYHPRPDGLETNIVYWGQLKLFLSILQALVEYWDPILVPKLVVVYAGAAPGWSFGVLASMFPEIQWHLYDDHKLDVPQIPGRLKFYEQYFTDKDAHRWARQDNVFFFSDIRRFGKETFEGQQLEETISEDMALQAGWVKIMNPYRASLKFRAPYNLENPTLKEKLYLDGNIMLQSFNSMSSAEARLIPIRDPQTGKYYEREYDWKLYEDQLAYYNNVTRETELFSYPGEESGLVPVNEAGLDNHHDSVHLLLVLDEYRRLRDPNYGPETSSVPLARQVMKQLSSYGGRDITLNTIRETKTESED